MRVRLGGTGVGPTFANRFDITEIGIRLALGELDAAERLATGLQDGFRSDLARAWVALLQGRAAWATTMSQSLATRAATPRHLVEVGVFRIRLALAEGAPDLDALTDEMLTAAEPVGFLLPIAEAGAGVLQSAIQMARRRPRTPFVEQLLLTQPLPRPADQARPTYTVDELSARELVVLRYMATSMTNQEIAAELYLSVNTVKTHIKHVLRKLGGTSRTDAVRRAQDLHYL
jgi:LuxR family maltose regulon positive regulatory protein